MSRAFLQESYLILSQPYREILDWPYEADHILILILTNAFCTYTTRGS